MAKAFLRDRASDGSWHGHGIRGASWDGDVYSIAANLDAGELVDDPRDRPLLVAIQHGHVEAVKMLIANGASTGGVYDENLFNDVPSPLILAIRKGQRDFVAMLLEHAASVDERECGWRLEYPLHAAVYSQDFEILKALLKIGPKVDCLDFL